MAKTYSEIIQPGASYVWHSTDLIVSSRLPSTLLGRPWQIMLKFLPIFLFLYSPIFHLFFFLFYLFCFSINPFFSNIVVAAQLKNIIRLHYN